MFRERLLVTAWAVHTGSDADIYRGSMGDPFTSESHLLSCIATPACPGQDRIMLITISVTLNFFTLQFLLDMFVFLPHRWYVPLTDSYLMMEDGNTMVYSLIYNILNVYLS